ncbi:MAG: hypothetical protein O2800_02225 [Planctomycetota bacterium]|nr:hypothetical protein [Planctomycetota bacterium]
MSRRITTSTFVLVAVACTTTASPDSLFATLVVEYVAGASPAGGFTLSQSALGEPTRMSGGVFAPSVVTPFAPAWMPSDVVSIGAGGSITLAFDIPIIDDPSHLYGVDAILFGNSFFTDMAPPSGVASTLISDGGLVDVSEDGVNWFTIPGVVADGLWPTLGYRDVGPYATVAGSVMTDFSVPIDPSLEVAEFTGLSWDERETVYGASGGGRSIDLASVGLARANFVRIRVPIGHPWHVEVDAVAVMSVVVAGDLTRDGLVNGEDIAQLLGAFGNGAAGDLNNDGATDGTDLALLLGAWS